jgi:ribosomal protein S18 acetylase RimI-like enzyme
MITYRSLHPAEERQALDLWAATIAAPREAIELPYWSDPQRLAHTRVAVTDAGAIIAAAHYCVRQIRDAAGRLQLVGGVAGVATNHAYRRQGHARRLMEELIAAMQAVGCRWSLLFTTANDFYAQLGWRTFTTRYREGRLAPVADARPTPYAVRPFVPQYERDGWAVLRRICRAYNRQRPLTTLRDATYWRTFAGVRFTLSQAQVFVAVERATERICGYILAYVDVEAVAVIEAGALNGHDQALDALLTAVRRAALSRGIVAGRVYLPVEPAVDAAVAAHFETVIPGTYQVLMGRPLAADYTLDMIEAAFAAPGAIAWPVDDF